MANTDRFTTVVVTLLVVLAPLAVLTIGAAGTADAQPAGTVTITTDEITSDSSDFGVEITNLGGTFTGCLVVTNSGTGETVEVTSVSEDEQFTFFEEEFGGFEAGDEIEATLYDKPSDCTFELDTDSRTVQPTAVFEVSMDKQEVNVTEGETADVPATIENVGDAQGSQTVELLIGNIAFLRTLEDTVQVALVPGQSQQVVLSWATGETAPGAYDATVQSEDDSNITVINVKEAPPAFDITTGPSDQMVAQGEPATVSTTVENTGGDGDQMITLTVGDDTQTQTVTLAAGATQQVTFDVDTTEVPPGAYSVAVSTDEADATATLTVEASVETYRPSPGESVSNSGVTQAILDWQQGEIGNDLIVDVVLDWQN